MAKLASSRSGSSSIPADGPVPHVGQHHAASPRSWVIKKQGIVYAFLRIGNGKVMDNVDQRRHGGARRPGERQAADRGRGQAGQHLYRAPHDRIRPSWASTMPYWEEAKAMCLEAAQEGAADALCGLGCSHYPGRPHLYRGELLPQPRHSPVCCALPGRHRDSCGSSGSSSTSEPPEMRNRGRTKIRRGFLFHFARDFFFLLALWPAAVPDCKIFDETRPQAGKDGSQRA